MKPEDACTSHEEDACRFLKELTRKQRRVWLVMLLWWIGAVCVLFAVSRLFPHALPSGIEYLIGASFLLALYLPMSAARRTKCPFCGRSSGALAFWRYRFLDCRACGERIECRM